MSVPRIVSACLMQHAAPNAHALIGIQAMASRQDARPQHFLRRRRRETVAASSAPNSC